MTPPKMDSSVYDFKNNGSTSWRVIGISESYVSLTGPGPCRGMKDVPREEFEENWRTIPEKSS